MDLNTDQAREQIDTTYPTECICLDDTTDTCRFAYYCAIPGTYTRCPLTADEVTRGGHIITV